MDLLSIPNQAPEFAHRNRGNNKSWSIWREITQGGPWIYGVNNVEIAMVSYEILHKAH
jgi:hypothetical protein